MNRPKAVALDIIETVFSLEALAPRLAAVGLPPDVLRLFFAQLLRDAFALEASGTYKPFREVAAGTLQVLLASNGLRFEAPQIDAVLAGFAELPAHPDVRAGLERLRQAGIRTIALTNGGADNTRKLLERASLTEFVEAVVSVDEVRHWKTSREVYLRAADRLGVRPPQLALIATHAWDVHGAKQAGLVGAWIRRQDKLYHPAMLRPDVEGGTFLEVAEALIALPA